MPNPALCLAALMLAGRAAAAPPTDAAAFLAATWEVMMYDHVDLRDGAWILESSGFSPESMAADLAVIIRDPDTRLGVKAAGFLARIGPRAAAAAPALAEGLLDERSADLRWACAKALARIGPPAKAAVHPLLGALQDPEPLVRAEAARALGRIGASAAVARQALAAASRDPEPEVRRAAAEALLGARGQPAQVPGQ